MILFFLPMRLRERLRRNRPVFELANTVALMVLLFVLLAVAYKVFEKQPWMESFWQSWQTETTVGYGNKPAVTTAGRIATIILGTTGIALLGVLFSRTFSFFEYRSTIRRLGMRKNPSRGGYVIFNYPGDDQFSTFIEEIRLVEGRAGVCIVDNKLDELPRWVEALGNVHFVRGSVLARETYDKARINRARCVIVFPVETGKDESDASTRMVVDLVAEEVPESTRIIYVLVDQRNRWLFHTERATGIPETLEMLALVQECQDRYTAPIVEDILLNSRGPKPFTVEPGEIAGITWGEFSVALAQLSAIENLRVRPFALVGSDGEVDSCPLPSQPIGSDNMLSLLGYADDFDWVRLRKRLAEARARAVH